MENKIEDLGKLLYQTFFYNHSAYALQEIVDGEVCFFTKHERIDANKINYYIREKKSILAYQQNFDKLNWVCLDFDIVKNVFQEIPNYDFINDDVYKTMLIEEVNICCEYLRDKNILFLLEYSGNRGIHIWLFFEVPITKRLGYTIIEKIVNSVPFKILHLTNSPITIDLFPKVPSSKNNVVGKGVKIPLSYHLKSNSYAYLIEDLHSIERIDKLSGELIEQQIEMLNKPIKNNINTVIENLRINELSEYKEYERIRVELSKTIQQDDLVKMLSKSLLFTSLFDRLSFLNENERRILVGTFSRIEYNGDKDYGIKLLKNIFATTINYDEEVTNLKIDLLKNLYPPNIQYIEKILNLKCDYCEAEGIKNVLELLDNVTIQKMEQLGSIIEWSKESEINYLNYNDEVPLNFIEDELKSIEVIEVEGILKNILTNGVFFNPKAYKYIRNESDKYRTLYSLSGIDRVITTSLMKYIYDVIGVDTISPMSYSYRINSNSRKNIFMNWNSLWMEYIKAVQSCTNHEAYDDYYVIKLDVKDFYDSINLTLLKEILTARSRAGFQYNFIKLSIDSLNEEEKKSYHNAINYLIDTCKYFSDNGSGVPQGPAYARYLAELYLASFDEFLISKLNPYYDFACRYVDDYYVFIKDPIIGEKLKDDLISELSTMYLKTNSKLKYGILRDIKYEIEIKNQIEKYFVDGIDSGTPDNIMVEGKKILNSMYKDFIDNKDIKDFPFFLTHLWDDEFLKSKSSDLIKKVIESTIGRGSLFKHFYNRVATKYSNMAFYNQVTGLSRANLITSLMRNECQNFTEKEGLVNYYLSLDNLYDYEKKELLRYILIQGISVNISLIKRDDYDHIISLIKTIPTIEWTEKLLDMVISRVQDISNKSEGIMILEKILSCSKNMPNNKLFIEIVYAIIRENELVELNKNEAQKLYNLIAYSTLFVSHITQVKAMWIKLLSNKTGHLQSNQWLKFSHLIKGEMICSTTVTGVLIQLFSDYSFLENATTVTIEREFAYYLFLELSNYSNKKELISENLYLLVKQVAQQQNAISLLWCCEGAEYYLDKDVSAKNIEFNERVILIKGQEILVRGKKEIFDGVDYLEENIDSSIRSYYKIYPILNTLTNYNERVSQKDLLETLKFSHDIISNIKVQPINIFEKGSLIEEHARINYKYSKDDTKFVINKTEIIEVDFESVIEKMIDVISTSGSKHNFVKSNLILEDKDFKKIVVPYALFAKSRTAKYMYFEKLCKLIHEYSTDYSYEDLTLHAFEGFKLEALYTVIEPLEYILSSKVREMKAVFKVLELYNKLYKNTVNFVLYSKITEKAFDLCFRIYLFKESISNNLDCGFISELLAETEKMKITCESKFGDLQEYKKIKARAVSDTNLIEINDERIPVQDLEFYYFDGIFDKLEFEKDDLVSLNYVDMYMKNQTIIIMPELFTKAYDLSLDKDNSRDLKNLNKQNLIKSYPLFRESVNIIVQQNGNMLSREIAEDRIIQFLSGKDTKYYHSILSLISRYRVIRDSEYNHFKEELIDLLNKTQISTISLKNYTADRNGLDLVLKDKFGPYFDRGKIYDIKFKKSVEEFFAGKQKKSIAFVSDVGISGQQFKSTINSYLEKSGVYESDKLFKYDNDVFRSNIDVAQEFIFLNCIYTNIYKETVSNYFKDTFGKMNVKFLGTEINISDEGTYIDIHPKIRGNFKEFIDLYYNDYLSKKVVNNGIRYEEYLEIPNKQIITDTDKCKMLMLLRYRSMPKYHHIVFSGTIFDYRKE